MKRWLLVVLSLTFLGCATSTAVGSRYWHDARLTELRDALASEEISTEKYLELKNEADKIRLEYSTVRSRDLYYSSYYHRPHLGLGFGYCYPFCH